MKFYFKTRYSCAMPEYRAIVAIAERSEGNESVGTEWIDARTFPKETPVATILEWAHKNGCEGKLIITIDDAGVEVKT